MADKCTWEGCTRTGGYKQVAKDGQVWATLCGPHHTELDEAMATTPARMIGAWIKAQGGAKAAARRMIHHG